jgi:hypothetical protein
LRLSGKVRIESANNDACVIFVLIVQPNEVPPIQCENRAIIVSGKLENGLVGNCWSDLPVSAIVRTSWPAARSASTTGSGKFSFAYNRAI